MRQVAGIGPTLKGIDVYHGDAVSFFAPNDFVFLKATQGGSTIDSKFQSRWADLFNDKIVRGAYHFFDSSADGVTQAKHFLATIGTLLPTDLPPTLDLEQEYKGDPAGTRAQAIAFLEYVKKETGRTCLIYGSPYFLEQSVVVDSRFAQYPLWIADYGDKPPRVPNVWGKWTFWQYTDHGVDQNFFNGDRVALDAFIKASQS